MTSKTRIQKYMQVLAFCLFLLTAYCLLLTDAHALEVREETTPGKLQVLQVERHKLPVVTVTLLVKASPLNEPADKAGLASMTSRMLTEGTSKRDSAGISDEVDFLGASLGASTNEDFTVVSLSVLKKDIEQGFELFSDVLLNPSFPESELKRLKELTKGALRQREEEPAFIAGKTFIKEVFGSHPYGRIVQGSIASIDRITRDDLVNFYRAYYRPDNAILSVVGDLTPRELDSLLAKYLSGWKGGTAAPAPAAGNPSGEQVAAPAEKKVCMLNRDVTQATIILGNHGIARSNPDYYAVSVMNYILGGGGFSSRMMKIIRDQMGLAYSIYSSFIGNKEPGQFQVEVQTKNESADVVIEEILHQIRRIRTEPVTDQELADAKSFLTGSFPRRLETGSRIAEFLTAAQFYELGDDYIEKYPEYINRVTKEDVLRVAKKYLDPENYKLVIVCNEKKADYRPSPR